MPNGHKFIDVLKAILFQSHTREESIPRIRKATLPSGKDPSVDNKIHHLIIVRQIAYIITWFMIIAFSFAFLAIITLSILGKERPPELSQVLSATLGYLGGLIVAFSRSSK